MGKISNFLLAILISFPLTVAVTFIYKSTLSGRGMPLSAALRPLLVYWDNQSGRLSPETSNRLENMARLWLGVGFCHKQASAKPSYSISSSMRAVPEDGWFPYNRVLQVRDRPVDCLSRVGLISMKPKPLGFQAKIERGFGSEFLVEILSGAGTVKIERGMKLYLRFHGDQIILTSADLTAHSVFNFSVDRDFLVIEFAKGALKTALINLQAPKFISIQESLSP